MGSTALLTSRGNTARPTTAKDVPQTVSASGRSKTSSSLITYGLRLRKIRIMLPRNACVRTSRMIGGEGRGQRITTGDLSALEIGSAYLFCDWPHVSVPRIAACVYTIWEETSLIYVGMAGRGLSAQDIAAPDEPRKVKGLWSRLNSHASGRRTGDQSCVYVCDRFIITRLLPDQQAGIGAGNLSLDALNRQYIHDHFSYRYVETEDGSTALALEREIQVGGLGAGKPFLNPLSAAG